MQLPDAPALHIRDLTVAYHRKAVLDLVPRTSGVVEIFGRP